MNYEKVFPESIANTNGFNLVVGSSGVRGKVSYEEAMQHATRRTGDGSHVDDPQAKIDRQKVIADSIVNENGLDSHVDSRSSNADHAKIQPSARISSRT